MTASHSDDPGALPPSGPDSAGRSSSSSERVHLIGGPYVLRQGVLIPVPEGSKRLLAFIAIHQRPVDRRYAAGTLWATGGDDRAAGNLRSSLWRLRMAGIDVISSDRNELALSPGTVTDVHEILDWAHRILDGSAGATDMRLRNWGHGTLDILPGWYDDWVVFERERLRQRILHALEAMSRRLRDEGRFADAVEAAIEAVAIEPLRESAQRSLIEAHVAEGNLGEARRTYAAYADLVGRELGVEPASDLAALVGGTTRGRASA